jgi:hypothetical protein
MLRRIIGARDYLGLQLIDDVQPGIDLMDVSRADHFAIRQEKLKSQQLGVAPVAGQFSNVTLINPAGSGLIKVCTRVHSLRATAASDVNIGLVLQSEWTPTFTQADGMRDARLGSRAAVYSDGSVSIVGANAVAVILAAPRNQQLLTALASPDTARVDVDYVLVPGTGLMVECPTANTLLRAGFDWYEFQATGEELTGSP